mgnify:CR=1 FL=1
MLSFIVALKGFVADSFDTGTTSVCPDKIIGFLLLEFFDFSVANKLTLFLLSSNVLKEVAPSFFKILSVTSFFGIIAIPESSQIIIESLNLFADFLGLFLMYIVKHLLIYLLLLVI